MKASGEFAIVIDGDLYVGLLQTSHAEALFRLQEHNRPRLEAWMPFMDSLRSVEDVSRFIRAGLERFGSERGLSAGIWWQGELAGWIGMRVHEDGYGTLGYWIGGEYEGKGLATKAVLSLVAYAFDVLKLARIEIRCEPANTRSIAVAERAGFRREGLLRDAICVRGVLQDLVLFARVARVGRDVMSDASSA
jgi:ribosomal-protein-serine acetyltransferase